MKNNAGVVAGRDREMRVGFEALPRLGSMGCSLMLMAHGVRFPLRHNRGVAQTAVRLLWEQEVAGSSPAVPTNLSVTLAVPADNGREVYQFLPARKITLCYEKAGGACHSSPLSLRMGGLDVELQSRRKITVGDPATADSFPPLRSRADRKTSFLLKEWYLRNQPGSLPGSPVKKSRVREVCLGRHHATINTGSVVTIKYACSNLSGRGGNHQSSLTYRSGLPNPPLSLGETALCGRDRVMPVPVYPSQQIGCRQ